MVSEWRGKMVLVTGAGGFIGSHLAEALSRQGARVRALVHYNALGSIGWLQGSDCEKDVEVVAGDLCDRDSVSNAIKGTDTVFHLAALIAIPYSYQAPASYVRTNIEGTVNVLQGCRQHGVSRLVHTSTSEVYGTARDVPIRETHPLHGQSPYSASKIGADKMVEAFSLSYGVPVVTVRPFNTFGPRQSARAIIPTIVSQLACGSRVRLGNIEPTRDLNYVDNTVDGFLRAGLVEAATGRTFNLGSGREISIRDLVSLIGRLMGTVPEIELSEDRQRPRGSEVERLLADASQARDVLGWSPRISLEDGLARTIEWLKPRVEGLRPGVYTV
jgi:NAD dependent epimerase/dehydratase